MRMPKKFIIKLMLLNGYFISGFSFFLILLNRKIVEIDNLFYWIGVIAFFLGWIFLARKYLSKKLKVNERITYFDSKVIN
ncbi:hypothetical protein ACH0BF_16270 [Pseudobacillus sp. 179-B 2D1 NHS]|uniref:hypothetical protein n=1 Tax=Pseudobacillus sp. 179-B 2D1 NHS TaxID=3374292 RepID=UPI00387965D9